MIKRFYNKLRMYLALIKVLMDNKLIWETNVPFSAAVLEFNNKVALIDSKRPKSEQTTNWITDDKHEIKEVLIDMILDISGQLYALGHKKGDTELMAASDFEDSDLRRRDADLKMIATNVAKLARANQADLVAYNVTIDEIEELEALTIAFAEKDTEPRAVVSDRKSANVSLAELFHESDDILNNSIEKMMKRYRRTMPEFFRAFENGKMIIDYGVRHEPETIARAETKAKAKAIAKAEDKATAKANAEANAKADTKANDTKE